MAEGGRMLVGLGNPGRKYAGTRHNLGFRVLDRLAESRVVSLDRKKFKAIYGVSNVGDERLYWVKPQTYMNLSGEAVRDLSGYFKVDAEDCLVIVDDLALPPGRIRMRRNGSAGGHNGLKSIIRCLGTKEFSRLRLGIGAAPEAMDTAAYVLSRFRPEEKPAIEGAIERALEVLRTWLDEGLEPALEKAAATERPPEKET